MANALCPVQDANVVCRPSRARGQSRLDHSVCSRRGFSGASFATIATAIAVASLSACGGADTFQPRQLPITRITALWATTELRHTYVIRTDAEWRSAWQAHEPTTEPPTERPAIDFTRNMVLGVTLGSGPNGCHGVSVRRVLEEQARVLVEYTVSVPPPGVGCIQAIVPLTDFVVVDHIAKPVAFVRTGA
jgi:hypothetical protein